MIHTPNIIEKSAHTWRQLLRGSVHNVELYRDTSGEFAEIVFTMKPTDTRLHVSWQQEDGPNDDRHFYWLSMQNESHFTSNSLVEIPLSELDLVSILDSHIVSIQLFGRKTDDAVLASVIQLPGNKVFGMATTRWMATEGRFVRCGSDDLSVLNATQVNSLFANQQLELVAEVTR